MKMGRTIAIGIALGFVGYTIWTWDSSAPVVDWSGTPEAVGAKGKIQLGFSDSGKGLKQVEVVIEQGQQRKTLLTERYAGSGWPWQDRTPSRQVALSLEAADMMTVIEPGPFRLEVTVSDQPNLLLLTRTVRETRELVLDTTPPVLEVLSPRLFIRQGGTEMASYKVSDDAVASGARVGESVFRGFRQSDGPSLVLMALAYNQPVATPIRLWAEDLAGNRVEVGVNVEIIPVRFRQRQIQITDSFIEKVAPEIISRSEAEEKATPLDTFLEINHRLRGLNHASITELLSRSADHLLFSEPFLQLSNSKVEAAFADERAYLYEGEIVDRQTHQGFDLASVARSPVEAANAGIVLWADYLGIYGNCVIVDHGLGLASLYGHLSSIDVRAGDEVSRGQSLGLTGQTGLAGGDHLHFSMIVQGVQVNPLEWWDPKWMSQHILR